ncbi:MAG: c-type cytochrome [Acidobacteria bacterium]|nr:c-type cytochrome [Acidobacteriota bacterium]
MRSLAILGVGFALALALPVAAQNVEPKDPKKRHPAIGNPEAIAAGKKIFSGSCAVCHGPEGQGGRGPNLRQQVMWHTLTDEDLFKTIHTGVPGADMPGSNLPEEQVWQLAAFVRWLTSPAMEAPPPGDVAAGEALFWGKGQCGNCHRVLGRGGMLGPDLSNTGARRSVEQLREAVLDPDADGFPGYRGVKAVLKDGRAIQGVARNRTNYSLQILDSKGALHLLPMSAVKELTLSAHSPMPGDYKTRFSRQELDDLVAYLSRRSVRPYEPSSETK